VQLFPFLWPKPARLLGERHTVSSFLGLLITSQAWHCSLGRDPTASFQRDERAWRGPTAGTQLGESVKD